MGDALRVKGQLDQRFAQLTYEGFWFSPLRPRCSFHDALARTVDGEVTLKLFKGSLRVVGRTSPHGLYNHSLSTYGAGDRFDIARRKASSSCSGCSSRSSRASTAESTGDTSSAPRASGGASSCRGAGVSSSLRSKKSAALGARTVFGSLGT